MKRWIREILDRPPDLRKPAQRERKPREKRKPRQPRQAYTDSQKPNRSRRAPNTGRDLTDFFTDETGQARRRVRVTKDSGPRPELPLYDLDIPETRAWFRRLALGQNWERRVYPQRPRGYIEAARTLLDLAEVRLSSQTGRGEFERLYRGLPGWAQWRRVFNPAACVLPGRKFRKRPPKRFFEVARKTLDSREKRA